MSGYIIAPAECPTCDRVMPSVFIRSADGSDLICKSCREGEGSPPRFIGPSRRPALSPAAAPGLGSAAGPVALPASLSCGGVSGSGEVATPRHGLLHRIP